MSGRDARKAVAEQTVAILDAGGYRNRRGRFVDLSAILARQDAETAFHPEDAPVPGPEGRPGAMAIRLVADDAVSAILAAGDADGGPCCLVFASARNPGGGFLNGANAQEESLARASTLYRSLLAAPGFHARHRAGRDLAYTDAVIHGPAAVIRDAAGTLLDRPVACAFLVAAAPNAAAMAGPQPGDLPRVPAILARRAGRVLDVAAAHGHRRLLLGAWGCGVFGNDPALVARTFAAALADRPWFDAVDFAVPDPASAQHRAFARVFPA